MTTQTEPTAKELASPEWATALAKRIALINGTNWDDLYGKSYDRNVLRTWSVMAWIMREHPKFCKAKLSFAQVAAVGGNLNHQKAILACRKVQAALDAKEKTPEQVELHAAVDRTVDYLTKNPADSEPIRIIVKPVPTQEQIDIAEDTLELLRSIAGMPGARTHERTQQMLMATDLYYRWLKMVE